MPHSFSAISQLTPAECALVTGMLFSGSPLSASRQIRDSLQSPIISVAGYQTCECCLCHTGEVTLTGRVLPIGGVKEKTIAARRSGVKTLIFPKANQHDFEELSGVSLTPFCPCLLGPTKL